MRSAWINYSRVLTNERWMRRSSRGTHTCDIQQLISLHIGQPREGVVCDSWPERVTMRHGVAMCLTWSCGIRLQTDDTIMWRSSLCATAGQETIKLGCQSLVSDNAELHLLIQFVRPRPYYKVRGSACALHLQRQRQQWQWAWTSVGRRCARLHLHTHSASGCRQTLYAMSWLEKGLARRSLLWVLTSRGR